MTRPGLAMSALLVGALSVIAAARHDAGDTRTQPDPRATLAAHLLAGRLVDAERVARAGGDRLATALGEVLLMRGRLAEADSVLQRAVTLGLADARTARVVRGEILSRRGDRVGATREARTLLAAYQRGTVSWSARDHVAAGRAFLLVSAGDAAAVRSALNAFDRATAIDPTFDEAALRASELLLDKYNGPDAKVGFASVLERRAGHPWALLGTARVMEFEGKGEALGRAREAIAANPSFTAAHLFIARLELEAERNAAAAAAARRALAVDPSALEAWAVLAAVAWLEGDSVALRDARASAEQLHLAPAAFYVTLADAAARQRRYADAAAFSAEALALDSLSVPALGALGTNRLRRGEIAEGRAQIERAFAIDPFNLWHKNTLDMLDVLATFRTVEQGRFQFVAPPRESDVLLPYLSPLLEEAYDKLAARYDYHPPAPIRMEIYEHHPDFSVRTVGLTGLGALGVSFGRVLAMDAPSAREPGTFNWGSTAWHELTHTFTLGLSGNRVPRWFSEGASVLEERRAREGWGADATPSYLAALRRKALRPVSQLNEGFVRPRDPQEVLLSYYHASLVCEMIETEFGPAALGGMLRAWREGSTNEGVFQRVLRMNEQELDRRFDAWVTARFADELGRDRGRDSERDADRGTVRVAVRDTVRDDAALEPLLRAVSEREAAGDDAGLATALERVLWVWPYDPAVHVKLAQVASRRGDRGTAVRERRAVIALGPSDLLAARVAFGRALLDAGDRVAARREVLAVLEAAPTYELAQQLLLDLRRPVPEGMR